MPIAWMLMNKESAESFGMPAFNFYFKVFLIKCFSLKIFKNFRLKAFLKNYQILTVLLLNLMLQKMI